MSQSNVKLVRRALHRLAVACHDEVLALDAAARKFGGDRGAHLRRQSLRRGAFLVELDAAVRARAGVPAYGASYLAQMSEALRAVLELVTTPQQHAAYVSCARMTARTARAYSRALGLELPAEVRSGLAEQLAEVEFDARELRWLRWGGSLSDAPSYCAPSVAM